MRAEPSRHRTVAFYLPQFHPTPENDQWWGRGFTDWTNVTRARPLFKGHHQPRLPADLGFYDLRLDEVMDLQVELAREAHLDAFCFYHYWFDGHELLRRPVDRYLERRAPDFPFMICWANENWSRRWNGGDQEVLIAQRYGEDDDRAHIRRLLPLLGDDRYLRVEGAAPIAVYRVDQLPSPGRTAEIWRSEAEQQGLALHLCAVESSRFLLSAPPPGFDAVVQFLPQRPYLGPRIGFGRLEARLRRALGLGNGYTRNQVYDYDVLVDHALRSIAAEPDRYPCVLPGWDNSARRSAGGARIIVGGSPAKYEEWLYETLVRFEPPSEERNLVFVNAWNEWAEGAYLEPDLEHGRAFLDAHRSAVLRADASRAARRDITAEERP